MRNPQKVKKEPPPEQKLLYCLWLMGNTEFFWFRMSKSSLHHNMAHVTEAFLLKASEYIKWPETDVSGSRSPRVFAEFQGSLSLWMGHIFQ